MKRENQRKKRRRRILTETQQVLLIAGGQTAAAESLSCPVCGETSPMGSPPAAARLFGVGTREIYLSMEAGDVHSVEFEDRRIFVCLKSLAGSLTAFHFGRPG